MNTAAHRDPQNVNLESETHHGRSAKRPGDIPARGWLDVAWRTAKRFSDDNVTLIAGGLAMYALLSVFPALAAMVSIYGMFATPHDVIEQMNAFAGVLPPGVWDIFNTELQSLAKTGQGTLTIAAVLGIGVALWSARSAMSSLMTATNIAYRQHESRSFIRQTLLSLAFTVGAVLAFIVLLTLGVAIPLVLTAFGASDWTKVAISVLRVMLLWAVSVGGLAVIYRYAPAREHARWRWVSPGSLIASTILLGATALFGFYVTNFAGYAKTYGALGGVVVLLMWFFISSIVVVVGAQINAETERQTVKDTTVRRGAPLGQRGAFAADTVGPSSRSSGKGISGSEGREPPAASSDRPAPGLTSGNVQATRTHMDADPVARAARTASDASTLIQRAATVADPARSAPRRIFATVSALRLGARLLPSGLRLVRQYPIAAALAMAGMMWAVSAANGSRRRDTLSD